MRTQVDRLGRRPRASGPKTHASWPWSSPRALRWGAGTGHRSLPYWRHRGPTRPKPRLLRGPAGDSPGLSGSGGRFRLTPQLPMAAPPEELPGPGADPSQQSLPLACSSGAHPPLGHPGGPQSPPPPSAPAAPQVPAPVTRTDVDPPATSAAAHGPHSAPGPGGLLAGVQRAQQVELWGGEQRALRWGSPTHCLHLLGATEDTAPSLGRLVPSPSSSRTFPVPGP